MFKSAEEVMQDLVRPSGISFNSDSKLAGAVEKTAAEDDERRAKDAEAKGAKAEESVLRRKPGLQALREWGGRTVELRPWDVLHMLGRAIAVSRRGAARGLAEHWGALKYSQALTGDTGSFMKLSAEGKAIADYYKATQSGELGVGFALALAKRMLARQHPERVVSIVPADTALLAGWSRLNNGYRPQFFAELWKPGEASLVFPIACKGNHANAASSHGQLASASAHVEAVHIGPWGKTPALIFSTELPKDGHVTVHALGAAGPGGRLGLTESGVLDNEFSEENYFPEIRLPTSGDEPPSTVSGFHVTRDRLEWFAQVLARTAAAGMTAFAGNPRAATDKAETGEGATAHYLSKRQGRNHFLGFAHAAAGSVQDVRHTLLDRTFDGTDHVFRLNKTRVEAFSGVESDLLEMLTHGCVEAYRRAIYERRSSWPGDSWDPTWGGPVSVHSDGTVLAMRLLPETR